MSTSTPLKFVHIALYMYQRYKYRKTPSGLVLVNNNNNNNNAIIIQWLLKWEFNYDCGNTLISDALGRALAANPPGAPRSISS